jgi:hypothetical protein
MIFSPLSKIWRVNVTLLKSARSTLPGCTESTAEDFQKLDEDFKEFLQNNEHELALDMIVEMGLFTQVKGEFWRYLEKAAENMGLHDRIPFFRSKFE